MKTLTQCKNEAAEQLFGTVFEFVHVAYCNPDEERAALLDKCTDRAAELYADQFKPKWIDTDQPVEKEPETVEYGRPFTEEETKEALKHFTFSDIPEVNAFFQDQKGIYHDSNYQRIVEEFYNWQKQKSK